MNIGDKTREMVWKKVTTKSTKCPHYFLGPCFIKFGQAMSIRPDLLPAAFLVELQKLCDSVPSFPTQEAIEGQLISESPFDVLHLPKSR